MNLVVNSLRRHPSAARPMTQREEDEPGPQNEDRDLHSGGILHHHPVGKDTVGKAWDPQGGRGAAADRRLAVLQQQPWWWWWWWWWWPGWSSSRSARRRSAGRASCSGHSWQVECFRQKGPNTGERGRCPPESPSCGPRARPSPAPIRHLDAPGPSPQGLPGCKACGVPGGPFGRGGRRFGGGGS